MQWHQLDLMQYCKQSATRSRQKTTSTPDRSIFTRRVLFLVPNQQCQSTEGIKYRTASCYDNGSYSSHRQSPQRAWYSGTFIVLQCNQVSLYFYIEKGLVRVLLSVLSSEGHALHPIYPSIWPPEVFLCVGDALELVAHYMSRYCRVAD